MMIRLRQRFWQQQNLNEQFDRVVWFANIARVTIFIALMVFQALPQSRVTEFGSYDSQNVFQLYAWFAVYACVIVLSLFVPSWQRQNITENSRLPNFSAFVDISMMAWLMHLSGEVASGFAILLLPFLVVACLLSYGRFWAIYSGYASFLIILVMLLKYYPFKGVEKFSYLVLIGRAAVWCAVCYFVSWLTSFSARYLSSAGESVKKHRSAFERISALNKVVLNQSQEAILVIDRDCKVWLCNRRANQYFEDVRINFPFLKAEELVRLWRGNTKRVFETRIMLDNKDINVRAIPVLQEDVELLILFMRAEKELQAEAQSLKLASLGLLTANLAHEIRNPLSAMRQANGLLIENAEEDKMTQKLTGIIDKNIARVDKMIEDVSMLNKSDRVNKEHIMINDFWKSFRQEFLLTRPEAERCLKANIAFRLEVLFDPMHLQQIMWNLCNNAWRHSSKSGNQAVSITAKNISSYQASLMVHDDGGGVPEDVIPHLFEPFYTTQAHANGTGLGLYVARELAHANKGDLRYLPDKKAFEILLPRANHYD